jgi:hypothetical protein
VFIAGDVGVGGSPYGEEVPAFVCQCFGCGEGFACIVVVVLVIGERLDCSLVVDTYVDGGVWSGGRGGDETEAFVYGMQFGVEDFASGSEVAVVGLEVLYSVVGDFICCCSTSYLSGVEFGAIGVEKEGAYW